MSIEWDIHLGFDKLNDEMHAKFPEAIGKGLEYIRTIVTPMVPVETGDLAGSGEIRAVSDDTSEIIYPGPYALYQEIGVYYRHGEVGGPLNHTTGESYFLLRGMTQGAEGAIKIIGNELLK